MKSYIGKTAFITGAAGGIGFALAQALGNRGMQVMLADRSADAVADAAARLNAAGITSDHVVCDVADAAQVQRAAEATVARFGKVHFVVNNAGVSLGGPTGEIDAADWKWIVDINLMGVAHGVETFTPILKAHGEGGHIVNVASMAGHLAIAGGAPYTATKFAVVGLSESLRQELTPLGIGVSVLCPGWVRTDINDTSKGRPSLQNGGADRAETETSAQIAAAIDAGLDPAVVADWTLRQIDKDRFYIFTGDDLSPFVEGRFAEIKSDLTASASIADLTLEKAAQQGQAPLDVLVIGAGFSGVCAAIQLHQNGITNFQVFDKCDGIGGTWWLNTYPGAACDIPSHFYCYSFEMNPEWSRLYAPQPEIQAYIAHCAEKYGVRDRIHLGHEIVSIVFDEAAALWTTTFADGKTAQSRFVINGAGGLHKPLIPEFEGRDQFNGTQMHTAEWDNSFDAAGKRIAVIGSAASAIQAVPQLAKTAQEVILFQRTPNYIAARGDFAYSEEDKADFRADPAKMQAVRDEMFADRDTRLYPIVVNETLREIAAGDIKGHIRAQVGDATLHDALVPAFELGCKRILISDDFFPALNQENVRLETSGLAHMTSNSVVTGAGQEVAVDTVIYATGFDLAAHKLAFDVVGMGGQTLSDLWHSQTDAYRSVMVPQMPNYFMVTGPNAGVGTTSVVYLIEQSVNWIVDMIKHVGRDQVVSVKSEACRHFSNGLQSKLDETVWASGCDSWYISPNGRNEALFPGNAQDFSDQMSRIEEDDFVIAPVTGRATAPHPNWTPRRQNADKESAPTRRLDPTIKGFLNAPGAQDGPKLHDMDVATARAAFKEMVRKLEGPISIACDVEAGAMPLKGRILDYRIYRPATAVQNGPAIAYYHGGGWVIGDLDTHDNACRALANHSGIVVISVEYRRAPEHPFPAPVHDGFDAYQWILTNATELSIDAGCVGVGGDSAGANIAAVVTQMQRASGAAPCAFQLLIYPSVAAHYITASTQEYASGFGLDAEIQEWFAGHYIPVGTPATDPMLSPLHQPDFAGLPPALVFTAGFDPLRDAGAEYAQKLREAGVPVTYHEYPDLIHGFKSWAGIVPSAAAALRDMAVQMGTLARTTSKTNEPA